MVEQVDVLPTVVSLVLGFSAIPNCTQGRDLSALFRGRKVPSLERGWALTQYMRCAQPGDASPWSNPCSLVSSDVYSLMGYSLRTPQWRYTEWRKWNQTQADWSAAGLNATELYSHRGDDGSDPGFDMFENDNVASVPAFAGVVRKLSAVLRQAAAFPSSFPNECRPPDLQLPAKPSKAPHHGNGKGKGKGKGK